jgi:hypothetical protein
MKQTTVPMKEDARLIIRSGADVLVEGNDLPQLTAIVDDSDSFRMKDEGGAIYIRADADARLRVPAGVSLTLEKIGGDAGLMNLKGQVIVQRVGGDLTVQHCKDFSVDTVGGDCYFKEIDGSISLNRVGGDTDGFKVGDFTAHDVGGDMEVSGVSGKVSVRCGGDAHVQFNTSEIAESRIEAGGDISLYVLPTAKALLHLRSDGEEIKVEAGGQHLDSEIESYDLPLGDGGASVELNAGGSIVVKEGKETMGEFTFVFEDLEDNWRDFGKEIEDKIRQSMKGVNHGLRQAGWHTSEAMRKAADKMDEALQQRDGKVIGFSFDNEPAEPVKKEKKVVSDQERILVLKMLQEKKISVEEAEKLLQALEN